MFSVFVCRCLISSSCRCWCSCLCRCLCSGVLFVCVLVLVCVGV